MEFTPEGVSRWWRSSAREAIMTLRPGQAYTLLLGGSDAQPAQTEPEHHHFGSPHNPAMPRTFEEAEALPSGAHFVDPAGALRVRY